ncbi:FadR/GntR family transcriptional regulator [Bacillus infantis]|uniref:FadR/GntR family transcriptional regulator n=1 Tax=Bacillus infantis TaxID=324767 RepID=UPI003CEC1572
MKKKAYETIIDHLQHILFSGAFQPGDRLPTERELAARFKASRTSVREALRQLEAQGLLEIRQGSGSYLKASTEARPESVSFTIENEKTKLVYEMLELRRALEVECAGLAAQRAGSLDLEPIRQALLLMESTDDAELGIKADVDFHFAIVNAARNSIFAKLFETVSGHMNDTIRATRKERLLDPSRRQDTIEEHKEIFLAIALGHVQDARLSMEKHISQIRRELSLGLIERQQIQ